MCEGISIVVELEIHTVDGNNRDIRDVIACLSMLARPAQEFLVVLQVTQNHRRRVSDRPDI
jgi:hypothetical protein